MAVTTLGQYDRPASKAQGFFGKLAQAFTFGALDINPAKHGYEASLIANGKNANVASQLDAAIDARRFTLREALVIEALATGFVRY